MVQLARTLEPPSLDQTCFINRLKLLVLNKLYGDNYFKIQQGNVHKQKYKSYGENVIDSYSMHSVIAKSSNFGESEIKLRASEKIKFSSLGESTIKFSGVSRVKKGLVLGENEISRID